MPNDKPNKIEQCPVLLPTENLNMFNTMKNAMKDSKWDLVGKLNNNKNSKEQK
jgi:hypothetical protein